MPVKHEKTPEAKAYWHTISDKWELLSEATETIITQACRIASAPYLDWDTGLLLGMEWEHDCQNMLLATDDLDELDRELLAEVASAGKAAAASIDPDDTTPSGPYLEWRDVHEYYKMQAQIVELALIKTNYIEVPVEYEVLDASALGAHNGVDRFDVMDDVDRRDFRFTPQPDRLLTIGPIWFEKSTWFWISVEKRNNIEVPEEYEILDASALGARLGIDCFEVVDFLHRSNFDVIPQPNRLLLIGPIWFEKSVREWEARNGDEGG